MHTRHLLALAAVVVAPAAEAHEFWISPDTYRPAAGGLVRVSLFHGERFAGEVVPRDEERIKRFQMLMEAGAVPVRGLHGGLESFVRPDAAGNAIMVYEGLERFNNLPGERFEAYLAEEGLDAIAQWRAENGQTGEAGREAYVRCSKSLLQVGSDASEAAVVPFDREVGLDCEIILEGCEAGDDGTALTVRVLFEGAPLEGARVVGVAAATHEELIEVYTDDEGRAMLTATHGGAWMVTTLHMTRTQGREDADWKSYWASVTFEIGG